MIEIPVSDLSALNTTEETLRKTSHLGLRTFTQGSFASVTSVKAPFILNGAYVGVRTMQVTSEQGTEHRGYVSYLGKRVAVRTQSEYVRVGSNVCQLTVLVRI